MTSIKVAEINNLRAKGEFAEAIAMISLGTDQQEKQEAFQAHFLGKDSDGNDQPCLVLQTAASPQAEQFYKRFKDDFRENNKANEFPAWREYFPSNEAYWMFLARMNLVAACLSSVADSAQIVELILDAVKFYRSAYQYKGKVLPAATPAGRTELISKLAGRFSGAIIAAEKELRPENQQAADFDDPVLLMVAETLHYLQNSGELPVEGDPVESWVVLAGEEKSKGDPIPEGFLARLVIEKVPGGSGLLYPDCRYSGYLPLDPTFRQGLRNVMAVLKENEHWINANGFQFNYRWRLIPLSPVGEFKLPEPVPLLEGRSAEAAFACTLLAVVKSERLDDRAVISACFEESGGLSGKLSGVEGIAIKLLAFREEKPSKQDELYFAGMKSHRLHKFVLFGEEKEKENQVAEAQVYDWTVKFSYVETFDQAYRLLTDHCRITDHLNVCLKKRAKELLEGTCTPYVRSAIAKMSLEERKQRQLKQEDEKSLILTDAEVEATLKAEREKPARIQILAESGLGKSTMLIEAEHLIAASGGDRVPVRLGAGPKCFSNDPEKRWERLPLLSEPDFKWNGDKKELVEVIVRRLFGDYFDQLEDELKEKLADWIVEKMQRGEFVFLFDALDQTDQAINLDSFLSAEGIRDSPLLLSGRPEIKTTKSKSTAGVNWEILWVEPFDEARIKDFWGNAPHLERLLETKEWEPLRTIPILLHRMKELAENNLLEDLKNREQIYHRTLHRLLQHGKRGAGDAGMDKVSQSASVQVEALFAKIAWETIQLQSSREYDPRNSETGSFTGELGGADYLSFLETHKAQIQELHQINLTYRQTYTDAFEDQGEKFAWRHLSFCEWFAGIHLAGMKRKKQNKIIKANSFDPRWRWIFRFALSAAERDGNMKILNHLATCLLKYGAAFLLWEIIKQDKVKIAPNLDLLCRWLVHRDQDGREAWNDRPNENIEVIGVDEEIVSILQSMFECDKDSLVPNYRDSRWLHPAWELIQIKLSGNECLVSNDDVRNAYQDIHDQFLSEFEKRVVMASKRNRGKRPKKWTETDRAILQLVPEECFLREPLKQFQILTEEELDGLRTWPAGRTGDEAGNSRRRDTFNQHLRENKVNYCLCPPHKWERPDGENPYKCWIGAGKQRERHTIPPNIILQRLPVTNLQFEVLDPHHRQFRQWQWRCIEEKHENQLDDHPVVEVSFYSAKIMAIWMTGNGTFGKFDLPGNWDWEAYCRAGCDRENEWFGLPWDNEMGSEISSPLPSNVLKSNENEYGTIPVDHPNFSGNRFGLFDMNGRVREWCSKGRTNLPDSSSVRGGSAYKIINGEVRTTIRNNKHTPETRGILIGFRLLNLLGSNENSLRVL